MPDWCENNLQIKGNQSDIDKFFEDTFGTLQKAIDLIEKEECEFPFESILPFPDDIYGKELIQWCVNNWGCKLGNRMIEISKQSNKVNITILTAWSSPMVFFKTIRKKYPKLTFQMDFSEPGAGYFGGMICQNEYFVEYYNEYGDAEI